MNELTFKSHTLTPIIVNNLPYLTLPQIGGALEYADISGKKVGEIYNRHADEFTPDMSMLVKQGRTQIRVFSLRGCHLLAMFSKTPVAKEFRKWVLDLIEHHNQSVTNCHQLDAKAIGGIVKKCAAVAVREEVAKIMTGAEKEQGWELSDGDILDYLHNWHCTRNKADILKMQELIRENEEYRRRLSAIKQAVI